MNEPTDKHSLLRVLFALQGMPPGVQAAALTDREFVARHRIPVSPLPITFGDGVTIPRKELFAAFGRVASDGTEAEIQVSRGGKEAAARVRIADDGAGIVDMGSTGLRISNATLTNPDRNARLEALEKLMGIRTLSKNHLSELREMIKTEPFTEDLLVRASDLLNATPEEFSARLTSKLPHESMNELDFLPSDPRYWENLLCLPQSSRTLAEYVNLELREDRLSRLEEDKTRASRTLSLQFVGQELVPHDWLVEQSADDVLAILRDLHEFEDQFSLAAAFEICARRASTDDRFMELGAQLLDRLFGDTARASDRCNLFAAMFVLGTVRLSVLPRFRSVPIYWKRLAAAAHASLVVRVFGTQPPPNDMFVWAMRQHQDFFRIAVYAEMGVSPRWRPEWIDPDVLAADSYGRVLQALAFLADLPEPWRERIERAAAWVSEIDTIVSTFFPSLTQGERASTPVPLAREWRERQEEFVAALKADPSRDNLIRLGNLAEVSGVPQDCGDLLYLAAKRALAEAGTDPEAYGPVAMVAARMATLSSNIALAQLVADHLQVALRARPDKASVPDIVYRLLECAAAEGSSTQARTAFVRRMESFAALVPSGRPAKRLVRLLRSLRRISEPLNGPLAGAENLAILAATQS
jgi:hypothetical protein